MKNILTGILCFTFVVSFTLSPMKASASTVQTNANMQAQIQLLLSLISLLQQQLAVLQQASSDTSTVAVTDSAAAPVLSFSVSEKTLTVGREAVLTWNARNATRCVLQYDTVEKNLKTSGTLTVTPNHTTQYELWCVNDPGTGKDGLSVTKTLTVNVGGVLPSFTASGNISVNTATLSKTPDTEFIVSGTAGGAVDELTIVFITNEYNGGTGWSSVSPYLVDGRAYAAVSKTVSVEASGEWNASFGGLSEGNYRMFIYDAEHQLLGSGYFTSTWKG